MHADTRQTDRGPRTADPDGPRSARGLWRILQLPGIGHAKARRIADAFNSWDALAAATDDQLRRVGAAGVAELLRNIPEAELPRTIDSEVLGIFDENYPAELASSSRPPVLVWLEGMLPPGPRLAVVGTRHPDAYGTRVAQRAAAEAATAGIPVIAGMAAGIDRTAEQATIDTGGTPISVLPHGLDKLTPDRRQHADAIIAAGGAVLTEQPPGTDWTPANAMTRNRIVVGLATAVLIAQAKTDSAGTKGTIRVTLAEKRTLIAPRPAADSRHATNPASGLLMAITDPAGCPGSLLGLTGRHAHEAANRRPLADVVIHNGTQLASAITGLPDRHHPS